MEENSSYLHLCSGSNSFLSIETENIIYKSDFAVYHLKKDACFTDLEIYNEAQSPHIIINTSKWIAVFLGKFSVVGNVANISIFNSNGLVLQNLTTSNIDALYIYGATFLGVNQSRIIIEAAYDNKVYLQDITANKLNLETSKLLLSGNISIVETNLKLDFINTENLSALTTNKLLIESKSLSPAELILTGTYKIFQNLVINLTANFLIKQHCFLDVQGSILITAKKVNLKEYNIISNKGNITINGTKVSLNSGSLYADKMHNYIIINSLEKLEVITSFIKSDYINIKTNEDFYLDLKSTLNASQSIIIDSSTIANEGAIVSFGESRFNTKSTIKNNFYIKGENLYLNIDFGDFENNGKITVNSITKINLHSSGSIRLHKNSIAEVGSFYFSASNDQKFSKLLCNACTFKAQDTNAQNVIKANSLNIQAAQYNKHLSKIPARSYDPLHRGRRCDGVVVPRVS